MVVKISLNDNTKIVFKFEKFSFPLLAFMNSIVEAERIRNNTNLKRLKPLKNEPLYFLNKQIKE